MVFREILLVFFLPDTATPSLNSLKMMKRKDGRSPFTILNADRSNLSGTDWWNILKLYPKKSNCFYLIAMVF